MLGSLQVRFQSSDGNSTNLKVHGQLEAGFKVTPLHSEVSEVLKTGGGGGGGSGGGAGGCRCPAASEHVSLSPMEGHVTGSLQQWHIF